MDSDCLEKTKIEKPFDKTRDRKQNIQHLELDVTMYRQS